MTAVMSILNPEGGRVWWWGGYWSGFTTPDLMHFQADQPPDRVAVDWSTVAGSVPDQGGDDLANLSNEAQEYFQEIYDSPEEGHRQTQQRGQQPTRSQAVHLPGRVVALLGEQNG